MLAKIKGCFVVFASPAVTIAEKLEIRSAALVGDVSQL